jgi:hypothetical protein
MTSSNRRNGGTTKYKDIASANKKDNNARLCRLVEEHILPEEDRGHRRAVLNAVVLDRRNMRTSAKFRGAFHDRAKVMLIVPEQSGERKSPRVARMGEVVVRLGCALEQMLRELKGSHIFNVAYFDYCGTVTGDRGRSTFPLEDIQLFLKHVATRQTNVVLACTFALRNTNGFNCDDVTELFLRPLFTHCLHQCVRLDRTVYRQRGDSGMLMVFVTAVLRYDATLHRAASQVEFVCRRGRRGGFEGYR